MFNSQGGLCERHLDSTWNALLSPEIRDEGLPTKRLDRILLVRVSQFDEVDRRLELIRDAPQTPWIDSAWFARWL